MIVGGAAASIAALQSNTAKKDLLRDAIEHLEENCGLPKSKPHVLQAPQWLVDRMEALKLQPPISTEKVLEQWKAGAKWTKEHAHCPRHKDYFGDTAPADDNDCNHCWQAYVDRQQTPEAVKMLHEAMDRHNGLQC